MKLAIRPRPAFPNDFVSASLIHKVWITFGAVMVSIGIGDFPYVTLAEIAEEKYPTLETREGIISGIE